MNHNTSLDSPPKLWNVLFLGDAHKECKFINFFELLTNRIKLRFVLYFLSFFFFFASFLASKQPLQRVNTYKIWQPTNLFWSDVFILYITLNQAITQQLRRKNNMFQSSRVNLDSRDISIQVTQFRRIRKVFPYFSKLKMQAWNSKNKIKNSPCR